MTNKGTLILGAIAGILAISGLGTVVGKDGGKDETLLHISAPVESIEPYSEEFPDIPQTDVPEEPVSDDPQTSVPPPESEFSEPQSSSVQTADMRGYVFNTNTKKYHRPECSEVKKIKPENYAEFGEIDPATLDKYSPCRKCDP